MGFFKPWSKVCPWIFEATKQDKEGISCDDFLQFCKEIGYEEGLKKTRGLGDCGARRYP